MPIGKKPVGIRPSRNLILNDEKNRSFRSSFRSYSDHHSDRSTHGICATNNMDTFLVHIGSVPGDVFGVSFHSSSVRLAIFSLANFFDGVLKYYVEKYLEVLCR